MQAVVKEMQGKGCTDDAGLMSNLFMNMKMVGGPFALCLITRGDEQWRDTMG